ncbi:S8 family peptidase [Jiella pacifica]|uniref:S8 family serine peptidase n=1 Tax=Jiella pacifica TaxID=2696469 RepID=A0A6N9T6R8_9HYPH|nr:S8 family peptidase [Jiella pacifica]NDW06970.1 S8 family serine peptidase [Jiella pacifica]
MRRFDRRPLRDRRLHGRALKSVGILAATLAAGQGSFAAKAQESFAEASRQIVPGAAPALATTPLRLVDPTRVLVTLRSGENRESLRIEAARRQRESAGGSLDAVVAAIEAGTGSSGRSLVVALPGSAREQNGRAAFPSVPAGAGDFVTNIAPEAAAIVTALRQMPQVASVEPNMMRFANQVANPADGFNALLGIDRPPPTDGIRSPSPDVGAIDAIIGSGRVGGPANIGTPPALSDDPLSQLQWQLLDNAPQAAADRLPGGTGFRTYRAAHRQTDTAGPIVAIIDTGLVASHQDLARNRILPGYDFISLDLVANDGDGRDSDPADPGDATTAGLCFTGSPATASTWHGSHVAGIAGAVEGDNRLGIGLPGVAVRIVPVRVLGRCGGFDTDIIDALRWAAGVSVAGVPSNPNPAKVINMSLGGPGACPAAYQAAVDDALAAGAVVVAAAGNSAEDARQSSPASCAGVITVAASDARGAISPYSNFGPRIDVLAPGGNTQRDDDRNGQPDGILSIVSGGYEFKEGTSMAAPLVSAVVATLVAARPAMTAEEARQALVATALSRSSEACPRGCGAGLVQVLPPVASAGRSLAGSAR